MADIDLPDVNLWLSLIDPDHVHHARARRHGEVEAAAEIAFCRVTMLGLLRLLTNPRVMRGAPFTAVEAWDAYQAFIALPEIFFIEDSLAAEEKFRQWTARQDLPAHGRTDAWIAALASASGARVVSFDADFTGFHGLRLLHLSA